MNVLVNPKKEFEYEILSEEKRIQDDINTDLFWIIDPVDGTHNYISGLPNFGVSIALVSNSTTASACSQVTARYNSL